MLIQSIKPNFLFVSTKIKLKFTELNIPGIVFREENEQQTANTLSNVTNRLVQFKIYRVTFFDTNDELTTSTFAPIRPMRTYIYVFTSLQIGICKCVRTVQTGDMERTSQRAALYDWFPLIPNQKCEWSSQV